MTIVTSIRGESLAKGLTNPRAANGLPEFFARYRHVFMLAGLFSLIVNLALLAPTIYMLQVFDRVLTSRSVETLIMLSLIVVGALLLMLLLDYLRGQVLSVAGAQLERSLGASALSRLLFNVSRTGQSAYVYGLRDLGHVRAFLAGPGVFALFDLPWIPVYLGVIFVFSPLLGSLALLGALGLVAVAALNEKLTRLSLEKIQAGSRDTGRFVDAALRNAELVSALGMSSSVVARWRGFSETVLGHQMEARRRGGMAASATKFLRQVLQSLLLGVGAYLVIEQKATAGVMIATTLILGRALAPIETLIASWKSLVDVRAATKRLRAVFGTLGEVVSVTHLPEPQGAIALENVSFIPSRGAKPIVRNINLKIASAETVAIVGPSGSGKSTLARLIVGVWPASSGVVRIDGADVATWNREHLGRFFGYVPQDVQLFAGTAAENIARLAESDSDALIRAAQDANAHDMLLRLPQGYDTSIGEAGVLLSGGQRQRVALARALYGEPRIVVLDEPNAFLDSEGEQALARTIGQLKARRVTVVLITQRTSILDLADRILVMKDGMIERIGVRSDGEGRGVGEVLVNPAITGHARS